MSFQAMAGRALFALIVASSVATAPAQSPKIEGPAARTPAEDSQYTRYTLNADIARYLQAVDRASHETVVMPIGTTLATKDYPGATLYLAIITAEGVSKPEKLNRTKPTIFIFASQHGNEQSAKEAVIQLIRDLAVGPLKPLLKRVNFLVVPQANPYGNWINRRQNEQNLDLNRDHVQLEAPETRALHAVFRAWMPEVTLDVHEKGDDYYRVSTGCVSNVNIDPVIETFSRNTLLAAVAKSVVAAGFTWHEYLVTEEMGSTAAAGAAEKPGTEGSREMMTRYSTTDLNDGRNSFGIYETISFIQEGASRHDIETLKARTAWQYAGLKGLVEAVAANGAGVLGLVRSRREALLKRAVTYAPDNLVHLRMEYVRDPKQPELILQQFERRPPAQAGEPRTAAGEQTVVTEVVKNWFPGVEPRLSVPRPLGYVVPAVNAAVVKTLTDHGIALGIVAADTMLDVEAYRFTAVVPSKEDYVAPERIEADRRMSRVAVHKGDFFVSTAQSAANLISSLLEPLSEFGLIRYQSYQLLPKEGDTWPFPRVVTTGKLPLEPPAGDKAKKKEQTQGEAR